MIWHDLPVFLFASSAFLGSGQASSVSFRGSEHIYLRAEENGQQASKKFDFGHTQRRLEDLNYCDAECPSGDGFCTGVCGVCVTSEADGSPYCRDPAGIPHDRSGTAVENVALHKVATQSHTCYGGKANLAVDGNTDPNFNHGSVTHTCEDRDQWWMVDLGGTYAVKSVILYNRDSEQGRLSDFDIEVLDGNKQRTTSVHQAGGIGESKTFQLIGGVRGRYVRIRLMQDKEPLSLAEVEVMGYYDPKAEEKEYESVRNVAFNKKATQSCTLHGAEASRAVDGNMDPSFDGDSVTHTCHVPEGNEWWMVDLDGCHLIESVVLYNRDTLQERLSNFYVELLDANKKEVMSIHQVQPVQDLESITFRDSVEACFVKIRLVDDGALSLAEVEVLAFDDPSQPPPPDAGLPPKTCPRHLDCGYGDRDHDYCRSAGCAAGCIDGSCRAEVPNPTVNVARNKTASQCCTLYGADAGRAVDGNADGDFFANSVTHTCGAGDGDHEDEWWMVDLGGPYILESVKVFNRDSFQDRLSDFYVEVLDVDKAEVLSVHQIPPVGDSRIFHLSQEGIEGFFVRIRRSGNDEPLSLAEVEVMGHKL